MQTIQHAVLGALLCAVPGMLTAAPADTGAPPVSKIYDQQFTMLEHELVPLAEAMPAEKYDFAPTHGEFAGVRTFAQQVKHVAYVIYTVSASVLEQKNPSQTAAHENGPEAIKSKDEIVKYLKDAFAYGHKAMASLTNANQFDMVAGFGNSKSPRVAMASAAVWHSFDHYGQMVVYSRMNGVIPPASR
jgi:hypothetical protein